MQLATRKEMCCVSQLHTRPVALIPRENEKYILTEKRKCELEQS